MIGNESKIIIGDKKTGPIYVCFALLCDPPLAHATDH